MIALVLAACQTTVVYPSDSPFFPTLDEGFGVIRDGETALACEGPDLTLTVGINGWAEEVRWLIRDAGTMEEHQLERLVSVPDSETYQRSLTQGTYEPDLTTEASGCASSMALLTVDRQGLFMDCLYWGDDADSFFLGGQVLGANCRRGVFNLTEL